MRDSGGNVNFRLAGNSFAALLMHLRAVSGTTFTSLLEHKREREGTYFVEVEADGTTKACANCGVETEMPLWSRERSFPACWFEADRDANAAWNILSRGLTDLGVWRSEGTHVETALPTDTDSVSAKRVVETGSPCLKEPPKAANRQG